MRLDGILLGFFKSWRRKAGTVTLVMALALMIAHYRSFAVCDSLRGGFLLQRHEIASIRGTIAWVYAPRKTPTPAYCDSRHRPLICSDIWRPIEELLVLSYSEEAVIRKVPHATLAVALAILSAYLTLWKPPQRSSLNWANVGDRSEMLRITTKFAKITKVEHEEDLKLL